jgi:hypothetical protein
MVTTDTLEGIIDETVHFHYDVFGDVLYLRLLTAMETQTYGDLTDDGDIVLRDQITDAPLGLTVVSWWKRYGHGSLPDSISEIQRHVEPLSKRVAA